MNNTNCKPGNLLKVASMVIQDNQSTTITSVIANLYDENRNPKGIMQLLPGNIVMFLEYVDMKNYSLDMEGIIAMKCLYENHIVFVPTQPFELVKS